MCAVGWKDAAGCGACLNPLSDEEGNGWEKVSSNTLKRKACSDLSHVHANNNNNKKMCWGLYWKSWGVRTHFHLLWHLMLWASGMCIWSKALIWAHSNSSPILMHKIVVMIQPVISWYNRSPAELPEPTSTKGPASRNGSKVGMMSEKVHTGKG